MTDKDIMDRIDLQNAEFNALQRLVKAFELHNQVAVVDDFYPEARHRYESATREFLRACKANGRVM